MPQEIESNKDAEGRRSSATCYPLLVELFKAGFAVELSPKEGTDDVTMTISEAKNGNVEGCEVDLCGMEWLFAEQGIAERLREAAENLLDNSQDRERAASPAFELRGTSIYDTKTGKLICTVWPEREESDEREEGESWLAMRQRTEPERKAIERHTEQRAMDVCDFLNLKISSAGNVDD